MGATFNFSNWYMGEVLSNGTEDGCDFSTWYMGEPWFTLEEVTYTELSGTIAAVSMMSAALGLVYELSGTISATGTITDNASLAYVWELGGQVRGRSNTPGAQLISGMELSGSIAAQSTIAESAILDCFMNMSGILEATSELSATLGFLWEQPDEATWTDWEEYEGDNEIWILRVDEADDSWTEREVA